ncbi:hypothetical protein [Daejeonia sp. YH14]|uniref:hypothetical protein n=1 Tax=Daejeonia sp. YH14 TaxID=3439042 RepID=UPI003F497A14
MNEKFNFNRAEQIAFSMELTYKKNVELKSSCDKKSEVVQPGITSFCQYRERQERKSGTDRGLQQVAQTVVWHPEIRETVL